MSRDLIASFLVIVTAIFIGAGILFFSNSAASPVLADSSVHWTQTAGAGLSVPACGSSNPSITCSGGAPVGTITGDITAVNPGDVCTRGSGNSIDLVLNGVLYPAQGWCPGSSANYSVTLPALSNNTTYSYSVSVNRRGGNHLIDSGTFGTPNCAPSTIPPPPKKLSASCPSPGTRANVSWNLSDGATYYALRLNNLADGWDGSCTSPNGDSCPGPTSNSYSFSTVPNSSWGWWVHACNSSGCSDPAGGPAFICTPSSSPTPPGGPPPPPPPPPSCTPNGSCSAPAPACGKTTTGTDNCGNSCSRTGPACPPLPSVSIFVNNTSGTIFLSAPANYTLTWNAGGADSCTATGSWSGAKPISGSQSFSNVGQGVYSYGLFCTNAGGSASATVGVNVSNIHEIPP